MDGLFMTPHRMAGNASFSPVEPRVTHGRATDIEIGLLPCGACGRPFRPKRAWQKQCSARCRQSAYVKRQPIRTLSYYGAEAIRAEYAVEVSQRRSIRRAASILQSRERWKYDNCNQAISLILLKRMSRKNSSPTPSRGHEAGSLHPALPPY